ncbi:MAG TPA: zinc ribbon domain-containing protein [bacterium]|nr:zinc ribbon domain-containing protein [bacterium]
MITLPIFEYECAKCRKVFEVLSAGGASKRLKCPRCSSTRVKRLFSGFAVISSKGKTSSQSKSSTSCASCASKNCSSCR